MQYDAATQPDVHLAGKAPGRPDGWPLERWFPANTPLPGRLTHCPACGVAVEGRGIACDSCWGGPSGRGEQHLQAVLKAYDIEFDRAANQGRIICEMRAYFASLSLAANGLPAWTAPAWHADPDRERPLPVADRCEHFTLPDLTFYIFRTSGSIKRLVSKVAEGRNADDLFKKAFLKGRQDWEAYCQAMADAFDGDEPIREPNSIEGRAYAAALDRAEQIFELIST